MRTAPESSLDCETKLSIPPVQKEMLHCGFYNNIVTFGPTMTSTRSTDLMTETRPDVTVRGHPLYYAYENCDKEQSTRQETHMHIRSLLHGTVTTM